MAHREPTHAPLFPPGLHEMKVEALEGTFVWPGFDMPLRRRLTAQLGLFVNHLAELGVQGDVSNRRGIPFVTL